LYSWHELWIGTGLEIEDFRCHPFKNLRCWGWGWQEWVASIAWIWASSGGWQDDAWPGTELFGHGGAHTNSKVVKELLIVKKRAFLETMSFSLAESAEWSSSVGS
jgi:hypothetical protein